jgi:hypothetical protein
MAKSMNLNSAAGLQGMLKEGHKSYEGVTGAVMKNIEAGKAIAGMVRTSLGRSSKKIEPNCAQAFQNDAVQGSIVPLARVHCMRVGLHRTPIECIALAVE